MKRTLIITLSIIALIGITSFGFAEETKAGTKQEVKQETKVVPPAKEAQPTTETFRGKISSIDTAKNEIVVKNNKTGVEKTIVVDSKEIASLKSGEEIKAVLKAGTNTAESIKKIVHKTKPKPKSTK